MIRRFGALLTCAIALACAAANAQSVGDRLNRFFRPTCLTEDAGEVLQQLSADGILAATLAPGFTIASGSIHPHHIELFVVDEHSKQYGVRLDILGWGRGRVDGTGGRFSFRLLPSPKLPPRSRRIPARARHPRRPHHPAIGVRNLWQRHCSTRRTAVSTLAVPRCSCDPGAAHRRRDRLRPASDPAIAP